MNRRRSKRKYHLQRDSNLDKDKCKEDGVVGNRGVQKILANGNKKETATTKTKKCAGDLLSYDEMPLFFREPFIMSAYRKCNSSALYCLKSLFQATNETINVWSHALALVVFILRFAAVFTKHNPWEDSYVYPLFCFALGICIMLAMSVGAHLFNCLSIRARHICFFLDYAAISIYTFTAGQVFYFYSRPVNTDWEIFNNPSVFLAISAAISFASTFACCHSFAKRNRFDAVVKAATYSSSWVFNTSPYLIMLILCEPASCSSAASLHYFARHFLFYAGGTLAYAVRIPERLMIGVFDVLGHSHHFLHILCCIGASDEFSVLELDMVQRRKTLLHLPGPTFTNTILLTSLVVLGNFAVVVLCAKRLNLLNKD